MELDISSDIKEAYSREVAVLWETCRNGLRGKDRVLETRLTKARGESEGERQSAADGYF